MNERERDLIAALAEGSLDDETEARALLESSAEAQAEYRLQRAALVALTEAGSASLTDTERSAMHRDLWTELRTEHAKSRSTAGIYGWSLGAAALFILVGLAALLGGGVLNQTDSAGEAAEMFEETSADLAEGADTTTAAAEAFDAPESGQMAPLPQVTRDYLAEEADRLRRGETLRTTDDGDGEAVTCLARAGLANHQVAAVLNEDGSAPVDGRYLAAVPAGELIGPQTPVHFVDAERCEEVYTDSR